jgi:hypothetical protein
MVAIFTINNRLPSEHIARAREVYKIDYIVPHKDLSRKNTDNDIRNCEKSGVRNERKTSSNLRWEGIRKAVNAVISFVVSTGILQNESLFGKWQRTKQNPPKTILTSGRMC